MNINVYKENNRFIETKTKLFKHNLLFVQYSQSMSLNSLMPASRNPFITQSLWLDKTSKACKSPLACASLIALIQRSPVTFSTSTPFSS